MPLDQAASCFLSGSPRNSLSFACDLTCLSRCPAGRAGSRGAAPGIEPGTSRTLSANHATRPSSRMPTLLVRRGKRFASRSLQRREFLRAPRQYTWPGSNWRPSACWADVIATRPQVPACRCPCHPGPVRASSLPARGERQRVGSPRSLVVAGGPRVGVEQRKRSVGSQGQAAACVHRWIASSGS